MAEISDAAVERIMKKAGAERIADDAVKALQRILENVGSEVGKKAVVLSKHAKRKTVRAEDVELAVKDFMKTE